MKKNLSESISYYPSEAYRNNTYYWMRETMNNYTTVPFNAIHPTSPFGQPSNLSLGDNEENKHTPSYNVAQH